MVQPRRSFCKGDEMTHTDKFKTPVTTQEYRDNYNKIKWAIDQANSCGVGVVRMHYEGGEVKIDKVECKEFFVVNDGKTCHKMEVREDD
jgi:hypothetical protein